MAKCKTCANAVLDPEWAIYKCSLCELIIYHPEHSHDCPVYKEVAPEDDAK